MNNNIKNAFTRFKNGVIKHSPEILTGIGITSMVMSTITAVRATPKAFVILNKNDDEDLSTKKIVDLTWRLYVPSICFGVTGIVCILGGCSLNTKRNAALATAYALSEKTLINYKEKVIETIGEKKERELREKINQDQINNNHPEASQIIITSKGNTLMMDSISGRYFRSDLDTIRKIVNELNRDLTYQNYVSLNQFYNYVGLNSIKNGDNIGWNIDDGLIDLSYGTCLADNDEPCICIDYNRLPKPNFDSLS